ncbi:MAG: hypothetical protein Q9M89_04115 [Persephonella sp.]|nr:hypothetical protein [Persephonella sp.]
MTDKKYLKDLHINASAVLTKEELDLDIPQIIVDNPQTAFYRLIDIFYPEEEKTGISQRASISENVEMGDDVYIGDFTVIEEGVKIGNSVRIYPNCYIGKNTVIGNNTVIYPNAVIYRNTVIGKCYYPFWLCYRSRRLWLLSGRWKAQKNKTCRQSYHWKMRW